jgi:hypothetical protein
MKIPVRLLPTRELSDEEECILMDPETWDWDSAEEAIVEPSRYSNSEVRLSYDELCRIEEAASAEGMTVNAFLRHAALERALHKAPNEQPTYPFVAPAVRPET